MEEATPLKGGTSPRRTGWQSPLHRRTGRHQGGLIGRGHSTKGLPKDSLRDDLVGNNTEGWDARVPQ